MELAHLYLPAEAEKRAAPIGPGFSIFPGEWVHLCLPAEAGRRAAPLGPGFSVTFSSQSAALCGCSPVAGPRSNAGTQTAKSS